MAIAILALAGIPYLLSPAPTTTRTPAPINATGGTPLTSPDRQAVETLVRAHFDGTDNAREMKSSLSWGLDTKLKQMALLSRDQVNATGDSRLIETLRTFVTRNQTAGYDEYALVRVVYTTTGYFYDKRAKSGNSMSATEKMRTSYLGFGRKTGRWYELPPLQ